MKMDGIEAAVERHLDEWACARTPHGVCVAVDADDRSFAAETIAASAWDRPDLPATIEVVDGTAFVLFALPLLAAQALMRRAGLTPVADDLASVEPPRLVRVARHEVRVGSMAAA